ncbi:MAG TPA: hypothetical protein VHA52_05170 [Candidatus Babeliaceae bacterium]|nr:hypothetical protein [Candidatus Babeliaceae bacterium]
MKKLLLIVLSGFGYAITKDMGPMLEAVRNAESQAIALTLTYALFEPEEIKLMEKSLIKSETDVLERIRQEEYQHYEPTLLNNAWRYGAIFAGLGSLFMPEHYCKPKYFTLVVSILGFITNYSYNLDQSQFYDNRKKIMIDILLIKLSKLIEIRELLNLGYNPTVTSFLNELDYHD